MSQNGHGDADEVLSERSFPNAERVIRRLREARSYEELAIGTADALQEGLERQRELLRELIRADEVRESYGNQLRDIALGVERIHDALAVSDARSDLMMAMVQAVGSKVGLTKKDVEELQAAEGARRARDKTADDDAAKTRVRLDSLTAEVARVSHGELEPLAAKVDELEDTQQRRLLREAEAGQVLLQDAAQQVFRVRLNSGLDLAQEARAEERDERHHEREEKSKLIWWVLGIVALVLASAASGIVGRLTGHPIPVELPAHKE